MLAARRAVTADLPVVKAITVAAYEPYVPVFGGTPPPMTEDYGPAVAAGEVWMVMRAGHDVGVAVMEAMQDHLVILNLAVLPSAQGAGVGRWMLDMAEARARSLGLGGIRLYTNAKMTRNIGIYQQSGYAETGRRPNPKKAGWVLVDMAKQLT